MLDRNAYSFILTVLQADAPLSISDIPSSSHKSKSKPPTTTAEKEKQPEPSGDIDITKIREKHAQEQAAKEYANFALLANRSLTSISQKFS
jgi:hypothetical protein